MKKVYLKSYLNKNLGDDIFIKIILERYHNTKFVLYGNYNYLKNKNIIFKKRTLFTRIINKILSKFSNGRINYETILSRSCNATVILGGSMFIEKEINPYEYLNNKNLYILGINFGPYSKKEYFEYCNDLFSKAKDICFRDKKSFLQFKHLKQSRNLVDMILLSKLKNNHIKNAKNKVIFSVINCENKFSENISEKYYNFIEKLINNFKQQGFEIGLISFCEGENDGVGIKKILSKINSQKIDTYIYNGNIEEAIDYITNCKIIVGTRFHANILGILFNKKIIPIAYSDKTIDELTDIGFKNKIFDIRKINDWNINDIDTRYFEYNFCPENIKYELNDYFQELDKFLSDGEN